MIDPERVARDLFGLDGAATALPGEHDHNFRLETDTARYVLKLHAPRPDLALEDAVLEHLRDEPAVPRLAGTGADNGHTVRLLSWLDGRPWADGGGDLASLGRAVARVDRALGDFTHPEMRRAHKWDLRRAADFGIAIPPLDHLPHQVIHNDANEHNVLVAEDGTVIGLIDFGDVVFSPRVCGLAVAGAYAMQEQRDPARAVVAVVRGYHEVSPLNEDELAVLYPLMRARLQMSVAMAAQQHAAAPENDYLLVSQDGVKTVLERLEGEDADPRPLPLPRRLRVRGEPERAAGPPVPRARTRPPRDGGRPRQRSRPGPRQRHPSRSTAWRSGATTRSARSTPRPSSRRRTGAGARGTWRSTSSRPPGRRSSRRSTASWRCARTATSSATTAACWCSSTTASGRCTGISTPSR